jgi:hypothetical protein
LSTVAACARATAHSIGAVVVNQDGEYNDDGKTNNACKNDRKYHERRP